MNDKKTEALLAVAEAYLARKGRIQYDQRCMDRKAFLTPRRIKTAPPEAATSERVLFLDCSSYVGALYYETFGKELPADLTWHMIDYVKPRIYYYEFNHNETDEEKKEIQKRMTDLLLSGDVITYDRDVGSGHTMMYIGNDKFTHCTSGKGNPNSYDYENRRSREYPCGGLWVDSFSELFCESRLFSPKIRRVAISRPLEIMGEPTERAKMRLGNARGLVAEITSSHPGATTVEVGENIEYTLSVLNSLDEERTVEVSFSAPDGTYSDDDGTRNLCIRAHSEATLKFTVTVNDGERIFIDGPRVKINGLRVFAHKVLVGRGLSKENLAFIIESIDESKPLFPAVRDAYRRIGAHFAESETEALQSLFYLHDCLSGDILTRRAQDPSGDGALYSMFGGTHVATSEMISYPYIRCTKVLARDIVPGDVIVCSDDVYGNKTYSSVYTGEALFGKFEYTDEPKALVGEEIDEFLDSLIGRAVFFVLRPSLTL